MILLYQKYVLNMSLIHVLYIIYLISHKFGIHKLTRTACMNTYLLHLIYKILPIICTFISPLIVSHKYNKKYIKYYQL